MKKFAALSASAAFALAGLFGCTNDDEVRAQRAVEARAKQQAVDDAIAASRAAEKAAHPFGDVDPKTLTTAERKSLCGAELNKVWVGMAEQAFLVCNGPIALVGASTATRTYQRCENSSCLTGVVISGALASWNAN